MNTSDMISPNESSDIISLRDIFQHRTDGYVNITKLAKQYYKSTGKRRDVNDWLRNKQTQENVERFAIAAGIPIAEMIQITQGGKPHSQGTWCHPSISDLFVIWLKGRRSHQPEKEIQLRLHAELGGKIEVLTPVGFIDLLTELQLIEIKNIDGWKSGVGQLVLFGLDYPNHQKRLHLFTTKPVSGWSVIDSYCKSLNILMTIEN